MSKIRCSPPASHTISTVMTLGECPHTGAADGDQTCRGWQTLMVIVSTILREDCKPGIKPNCLELGFVDGFFIDDLF